jgi:hypothetical protein
MRRPGEAAVPAPARPRCESYLPGAAVSVVVIT